MLSLTLAAVLGVWLDVDTLAGRQVNLSHAEESDAALGSNFVEVGGYVGHSLATGEESDAFAELGLGHTEYLDYGDLSATQMSGSAGLTFRFLDAWRLRVAPELQYRLYGDDSRDTLAYGATGSLRRTLARALTAGVGYRFARRDARDDLFSYDTHALSANVVWRGFPRLGVTLRYGLEWGAAEQYLTVTESAARVGPGSGWRRVSTFGTQQELVMVDTLTHSGVVGIELRIVESVYVVGDYTVWLTEGDALEFVDQVMTAGLALRL